MVLLTDVYCSSIDILYQGSLLFIVSVYYKYSRPRLIYSPIIKCISSRVMWQLWQRHSDFLLKTNFILLQATGFYGQTKHL